MDCDRFAEVHNWQASRDKAYEQQRKPCKELVGGRRRDVEERQCGDLLSGQSGGQTQLVKMGVSENQEPEGEGHKVAGSHDKDTYVRYSSFMVIELDIEDGRY